MSNVAVIGAGVMGHAIALVWALGGHRVRLMDQNEEALSRAWSGLVRALDTLKRHGDLGADWNESRLAGAIETVSELATAVHDADIVIECIVESPEAKADLFAALADLIPQNALLLSNTSYLDIFPLLPGELAPRSLIAHWYSPPYIIDLVDIVAGPRTRPGLAEEVAEIVTALGQRPITLARFIPGYIANRIQWAITGEVLRLLDAGIATPRQIDESIIHGLGLRLPILGHLAKADFTGLDIMFHTIRNQPIAAAPPLERSETLEALQTAGRIGVKAGAGFHDWHGQTPSELYEERDRRLLALKRLLNDIRPMIADLS